MRAKQTMVQQAGAPTMRGHAIGARARRGPAIVAAAIFGIAMAACAEPELASEGAAVESGDEGKAAVRRSKAAGLRVSPGKPSGFVDNFGTPVWLTGIAVAGGPLGYPVYDWPWASEAILSQAAEAGANYVHFRLGPFQVNQGPPGEHVPPAFAPYQRVGSNYNLDAWNQDFWNRLRGRIQLAKSLGIYVELDLVDVWALRGDHRNDYSAWSWDNNVNGVDLPCQMITAAPPGRVRVWLEKIADEVGDLDNVIFQVGNETSLCTQNVSSTVAWEVGVADVVRTRLSDNGDPQHLFSTNGEDPQIDAHAGIDYVNYHSERAIELKGGKPSGVNEDLLPATPHRWMLEAWEGFSRGTWFHYWFGENDDAAAVTETLARMRAFRAFVERVPHGVYRVLSQGVVGIPARELMAFTRAGFLPPMDLGPSVQWWSIEWIDPRTGLTVSSSTFQGAGVHTFAPPTPATPYALLVKVIPPPTLAWELDGFNELAPGPLHGQNGWIRSGVSPIVAGGALVIDAPAPGSPGTIQIAKTVPAQHSGRHRLTWRARGDGVTNPENAPSSAKLELQADPVSGARLFQVFLGSAMRINTIPTTTVMLVPIVEPSRWYDLRFDLDLDARWVDAYVDGVLVASHLPIGAGPIAGLSLSGWDLPGAVTIDDLYGIGVAAP